MRWLLGVAFLFFSSASVAQKMNVTMLDGKRYEPVDGVDVLDSLIKDSLGTVFTDADELPRFPGGTHALNSFLSRNLRYPAAAAAKSVEGRVMVQFVVCEDGTLCNEKIMNGLSKDCDKEVLRVIKAMPKWEPGRANGKPVKVYYNLPVHFRLTE